MVTNKIQSVTPFIATHPGELLKDELKERKISQKDFSALISMPAPVLNDIIKGKRSISAEYALLFEQVLDIPATYWLNLQNQYDIDMVNIDKKMIERRQNIAIWTIIEQYVPVKIFKKIGLLSDNLAENIQHIWRMFRVVNTEELLSAYAKEPELLFYKKSDKLKTNAVNLFGWKNYAIWKSEQEDLPIPFHLEKEQELKDELNKLFFENKGLLMQIKNTLHKYGIKFLLIEKFDQTPIDGFSFWKGANPTIVLTARLNRIDSVAFSIMHELGHVFMHLSKDSDKELVNIDGIRDSIEHQANKYAQNALIPSSEWNAFLKKTSSISPYAIQDIIKTFAKSKKINPAIPLGLYMHEMNCYSIKTNIERNIN